MKKYITCAALAAGILLGSSTAFADSLPLPKGETLDLGQAVSVYDGADSFFGARLNDWLFDKDSLATVEKAIVKADAFPKDDKRRPRELAMVVIETLKEAKLFQIRTETADTYYQEFVLSVPVSDKNMLALMDLVSSMKVPNESRSKDAKDGVEEKLGDLYGQLMSELADQIDVTAHTSWKEGETKSGYPYRYGKARVTFTKQGITLPLSLSGYITRNKEGRVYTLFLGDQSSDAYLAPIVKEAIEGAAR